MDTIPEFKNCTFPVQAISINTQLACNKVIAIKNGHAKDQANAEENLAIHINVKKNICSTKTEDVN